MGLDELYYSSPSELLSSIWAEVSRIGISFIAVVGETSRSSFSSPLSPGYLAIFTDDAAPFPPRGSQYS